MFVILGKVDGMRAFADGEVFVSFIETSLEGLDLLPLTAAARFVSSQKRVVAARIDSPCFIIHLTLSVLVRF